MSFSFLTMHLHENTATVILSRPEKRNALSRVLLEELLQAFEDLLLQKSVRAVVLTGEGPTFCAGMDLKEMAETAKMSNPHEQWEKDARLYLELIETMLHFPKPIIAAVDGAAVAGGGGLVLASDIVIASRNAKFGFPEPRRGIVAGIDDGASRKQGVGPGGSSVVTQGADQRFGAGQVARACQAARVVAVEAATAGRD